MSASPDHLYFRQLLSGRDFAVDDPVAAQMVNFVYAIGDARRGECVLVDPAYDVDGLIAAVAADGMTVVGAVATHYHPDHVGGSLMGHAISGIADLLAVVDCPVHVQRAEVPWVARATGLAESALRSHEPGATISVGEVAIELLHTPGHTPGSQCLLVDGRLLTGDTLFLEGCGRTDLPGSDPEQMFDSLQQLGRLAGDLLVYPGHRYSLPSSATLDTVRDQNFVFRPESKQQFLSMFG